MPKGKTSGAFEQEARRCHDRAGRAAPPFQKALDCEAADWLALAERDRARRVQAFRAGFKPTLADSCRNAHQILHEGRLAS
jgi:hypothetical protein